MPPSCFSAMPQMRPISADTTPSSQWVHTFSILHMPSNLPSGELEEVDDRFAGEKTKQTKTDGQRKEEIDLPWGAMLFHVQAVTATPSRTTVKLPTTMNESLSELRLDRIAMWTEVIAMISSHSNEHDDVYASERKLENWLFKDIITVIVLCGMIRFWSLLAKQIWENIVAIGNLLRTLENVRSGRGRSGKMSSENHRLIYIFCSWIFHYLM